MGKYSAAPLILALAAISSSRISDAFTSPISTRARVRHHHFQLSSNAKTATDTASTETKAATGIPDFSSSTQPADESTIFSDSTEDVSTTWQENLEALLAPDTAVAKRQIVLSDLLNAAPEIQESVRTALRDGKIDGLLTPTQKRLQEGTRAVARQITSDILPGIAAVAAGEGARSRNGKNTKSPVDVLVQDLPTVVPKIGSRVLDALSNQAQKNFEELQDDIKAGDPLRSITRIQEQTAELQKEAKNVFMETPEGLVGPQYSVISKHEGYEIREYEGYTVASTSMTKVEEPYTMDDLTSGGEAFNALAAYLFGANSEKEVMEMTTPVTTTSTGEMRFYLKEKDGGSFPEPVAENDEIFNEKGSVKIQEIPAATLAVSKFTGFVTEGEVERQKDALLTSLAIDGVEVDVPHASPIPHVIFQYNPPYTVPMLRRNEIGVPVRTSTYEEETVDSVKLSQEWAVGSDSEEDGNGEE